MDTYLNYTGIMLILHLISIFCTGIHNKVEALFRTFAHTMDPTTNGLITEPVFDLIMTAAT